MHDKSAGGGETAAPHTQGKVIHWARFYDLVTALMSFGQSGRVRKATVDLAGIGAGERVLDVGCGTGTLTLMAGTRAGPSGEVHGIDASPEMIEVASGKAAKKRVEVGFQVALIEQLPFPDGHFDVVLSSLMLHHLPDDLKRKGFQEVRRVLKPGGRLLAIDLGARGGSLLSRLMGLVPGHGLPRDYIERLQTMAREAGFEGVESGPVGMGPLAYVRATKGEE